MTKYNLKNILQQQQRLEHERQYQLYLQEQQRQQELIEQQRIQQEQQTQLAILKGVDFAQQPPLNPKFEGE